MVLHPKISRSALFVAGLASRLCDGSPAVWQDPNVENCSTVEIIRIQEEVKNLMTIFLAFLSSNSSDRTVIVEPDTLQFISGELANVTYKNDTGILPNDLEDTINTAEIILRFIKFCDVQWLYVHSDN